LASDSEILGLYRSGQREQAFSLLVKAYSERIYWNVRNLVGTHEDADDLVQDIFIKIWNFLPSFREESGLFTWIYRIATNESLNFLRKKRVRDAFRLVSTSSDVRQDARSGTPEASAQDIETAVMAAMQKLPPKQRLVFSLRYFEELSYEQISRITGTAIGSLKASFHVASQKIRDEIKRKF